MEKVAEKTALFAAKTAKTLLEQGKSAENQSGEGCANTPSPWQSPDVEGLKMLAVEMPETDRPNKSRKGRPEVAIDPANLRFIREGVRTMHDSQIADALGWPLWRVIHVRRRYNIPAFDMWPEDVLAEIKRRYIDNGELSRDVAKDLGLLQASMTRKARNMGWTQSAEVKRANLVKGSLAASKASAAKRTSAPKPRAPVAAPAHVTREPVLVPSGLHLAPIVFAAPPTESETLGDRILRELSAKPLSAASLATLLGEKELLVSMQLSAFAHEGMVEAGPVGDRGLRYRVWSVVEQYSSRAKTAASLRCGPDSLVVAGEAA